MKQLQSTLSEQSCTKPYTIIATSGTMVLLDKEIAMTPQDIMKKFQKDVAKDLMKRLGTK